MASLASNARLLVEERSGFVAATVIARRGRKAELARLIADQTGLAAEDGPKAVSNDRFASWGVAPGSWLLFHTAPDGNWPGGLAEALAPAGSVIDQSSTYVLLRLRGLHAEALLQKGLFIDLALAAFPSGSCAAGPIAHIAVILARTGEESFEVAVPRSYVESFRHWLESAAEAADITLEAG